MNLDAYREQLAEFNRHLTDIYLRSYLQNNSATSSLPQIQDAYAELFSLDTIAQLTRLAAEATHAEIEGDARQRLLQRARTWYVQSAAREAEIELARCEQASSITIKGAKINARVVPSLIETEIDFTQRHDLAARWFDATQSCDGARVELWRIKNEAARELGFANHAAISDDGAATINDAKAKADIVDSASSASNNLPTTQSTSSRESIVQAARIYLERTDDIYRLLLARELAAAHVHRPARYADKLFLIRLSALDAIFPPHKLTQVYQAALQGFGITASDQTNIKLLASNDKHAATSLCFAVAPPGDVNIITGNETGGVRLFANFFAAAGEAQSFAWTSIELATRYPELAYPLTRLAPRENVPRENFSSNFTTHTNHFVEPDAVRRGYAYLFQSLLHDAAWLGEHFALHPRDATQAAQRIRFVDFCVARKLAALVIVQDDVHDASRFDEEAANRYAEFMTNETGFVYDMATYIRDAIDAEDARVEMQAHMFAANMIEHLRTRHGRRWWGQKNARDELIDLWNTGARYTIFRLAPLAGAGDLDAELLSAMYTTIATNEG